MTKFKIVAVSDTVCPWCYVGKQKLDEAISTYQKLHPGSNDEFTTTWMPFYLNPDSPKGGMYSLILLYYTRTHAWHNTTYLTTLHRN